MCQARAGLQWTARFGLLDRGDQIKTRIALRSETPKQFEAMRSGAPSLGGVGRSHRTGGVRTAECLRAARETIEKKRGRMSNYPARLPARLLDRSDSFRPALSCLILKFLAGR